MVISKARPREYKTDLFNKCDIVSKIVNLTKTSVF